MRKHLLTVNQAANGFIIEMTQDVTHADGSRSITALDTYVAKSPEEVLAFIQQHDVFVKGTQQQSLPL